MSAEEIIVCTKVENKRYCLKEKVSGNSIKIQDLTKEEAKKAAAAKEGAIEILQDALKKKDKVLMRMPSKLVTKGEEKEQFWMKRYAILTEDLVKKLLVELKMVRFKKEICMKNTFAFVNPSDETRTIYLCNSFWFAPNYLQEDSQPGTLIHEVSHFLGTDDIAYGTDVRPTLYVGCKGVMVKGNLRPADNFRDSLRKAFCNADNIEYEFEITINHKRSYVGGKYSCCGETARNSVCDQSVPHFFLTCIPGESWRIEPLGTELKELCLRSEKIKGKLREHRRIAKEMEESLRKAKTSRNIGLSMDIAGGAAAGASLFLAPSTSGLSLLVGGCIGVAGDGAGLVSNMTFEKSTVAHKKELDAIFVECQSFFDDVKTVITWLKDETILSTDWGFQSYSLLKSIRNQINLIIEEVESKKNDVQKIMYMESDIEQCAFYLEQWCKTLFV